MCVWSAVLTDPVVSFLIVEWSTSMDVCMLRSDPLSENVAAFCHHSGNTDCKYLNTEVKQSKGNLVHQHYSSVHMSPGKCLK